MAIAEEEEEEAAEEPAGQCCSEAMSPCCCSCVELAHSAPCRSHAAGLHGPGSAILTCPACCLTCVPSMVSQLTMTWLKELTAGPSAAADQPSNAQPSAASADVEEGEPAERPAPQGETRQTRSRVTPHAQLAAEAPAAPMRVTRSCRGRVAAEAEGPVQQAPLSQAFPSPPRVRGKMAKPAKEPSPVSTAAAEAPAQLEVVPAEQDSAGPADMEVAEPRSMQQEGETQVTLHGWQLVGIADTVHVSCFSCK